MQFRRKASVIEAVPFDNGPIDPRGVFRREEDQAPYVVTIHGQRCYIEAGDWILPEPDGVHFYPVKPDIFAATYEPVDGPILDTAAEPILRYFGFSHHPPFLQGVSRPFAQLAAVIMEKPRSAERTVALRKLLESKDAAVRAAL